MFSKTVAPVLAGLEVKSNDLINSVLDSTFFVALGTAAGNVSHCDSPRLPGDVLDRERGGGRGGYRIYPRVAVIHFCPGEVEDWITPSSPWLTFPGTDPLFPDPKEDPLPGPIDDPYPDSSIDPPFDPKEDPVPAPKSDPAPDSPMDPPLDPLPNPTPAVLIPDPSEDPKSDPSTDPTEDPLPDSNADPLMDPLDPLPVVEGSSVTFSFKHFPALKPFLLASLAWRPCI